MRNIHLLSLCLVAVLSTQPAYANVACAGYVAQIEIRPSNEVVADYGFGHRLVCTLSSSNIACQAILSQFMTAYATHSRIQSHHTNSTTCAQAFAAGTWAPAEPAYAFMIIP